MIIKFIFKQNVILGGGGDKKNCEIFIYYVMFSSYYDKTKCYYLQKNELHFVHATAYNLILLLMIKIN